MLDHNTEQPVCGATIFVDGEEIVETDENGRCQMKEFPSGVYNWTVISEGYGIFKGSWCFHGMAHWSNSE